ncbi:MAG: hypothetical protein ABI432_18945 [Flavobacteriales bacterium]
MKHLSTLLLLLCSTSLSAQDIFQRVFDCTFGHIEAIETTAGGTYVAYNIVDQEAFGYHNGVGIVKYGPDFQPIWNNVYMAPSPTEDVEVIDMTATMDGGLVFTGRRTELLNDTALVVKVNSNGQVAWALGLPSFLPPGSDVSSYAQASAVEEAPNGDLLVTGHYSYHTDDSYYRAFLARISASGTALWTKSYVSTVDPEHLNYGYDVEPLSGGGLALLGWTGSEGAWLARLQDDGTVLWSKHYSTTVGFDDMAPHRVFATSGGFDIFLDTDLYSHNLACVMHTDGSGGLQASDLYKLPIGLGVMVDVLQKADHGYALSLVTSMIEQGTYNTNAHLLVTDASGVPTLSSSFGSPEYESAYAAAPTADGGYLVGGGASYENLDDHRGGIPPRPFLVKTNAQGDYTCGSPVVVTMADTALTSVDRALVVESITGWASTTVTPITWLVSVTVCGITGVDEVEAAPFSVYPDPASDVLNVVPADAGPWDHALLDATGRVVLAQQHATGRLQLDVSAIAPGRYVLRSTSGPATRSTAVLVVR